MAQSKNTAAPEAAVKAEKVKADPVTEAEKKAGVLARRKARATGNVVERIDGNVHKLGAKDGRWIVRNVKTGKVTRHDKYSEMITAARRA